MNVKRTLMLAMMIGSAWCLAGCQTAGNTGAMFGLQGYDNTETAGLYMPVGQQVVPPMGYISFCVKDPAQCEGGTDKPTNATLTPEHWTELNAVNDYVNANVPQIEDIVNYGVSELWSYPNARGGDCEDLALLKRKMLIERGWSPADLLIAVVREWNGEGHAILVVDTDKGEYVLDNKNWAIVSWNNAPYTWVKRQSRERPYVWVDLDRKTFRTAVNDTMPPLGAPIPFVVAANAAKARAAETVQVADNAELRPSLTSADTPQGPTATLKDVSANNTTIALR